MANPFIEFVKKYQKDNNIKSYKEAITKASKVYKKQKDSASKPDSKKAKGLRLEITEKKKEKTTRGKSATKQQKDEDTENLIRKQSGELIKKHNKDLEKGDITADEHKDLVSKVRDTAEKSIKDKEKHLSSLNQLLRGGGLNVVEVKPDELQKMSKTERAKVLRQYKKVRKSVMDDIAKGDKPSDLEAFRKLGNRLKGSSTKNSYAKDLKAVDRKLNTKSFQKKNKAKELRTEIKEKKAPAKGKSETQFKKEQDLLNRVRKMTANNLNEAKRKFLKNELTEAQYVDIIKKIPEEVEIQERNRENAIKALKGLQARVARDSANKADNNADARALTTALAGATDALSTTTAPSLATASAPDPLKKLVASQKLFVSRVKNAVDNNNLNALRDVFKGSSTAPNLRAGTLKRQIERLEKINTKTNGFYDDLINSVKAIPLSQINPPAPAPVAPVAPPPAPVAPSVASVIPAGAPALDPTIPEPVAEPAPAGTARTVRMRNAERIHSKLHATAFALLHSGGVANLNSSLMKVGELFNQFNADDYFVSNENRRVVNDSGISSSTYIDITEEEIFTDLAGYRPNVINNGIYEVRTEPSAIFTEYDRDRFNGDVLGFYRNGTAVIGDACVFYNIPEDCLVYVSPEFAGNQEAFIVGSRGEANYPLNPDGTVAATDATRANDNVGADDDVSPEGADDTQKRLKQSHLTDFFKSPKTTAEGIADGDDVPTTVFPFPTKKKKDIKKKPAPPPKKKKDIIKPAEQKATEGATSKFLGDIEDRGDDIRERVGLQAVEDASPDDSDSDVGGGSLAYKTITPQSSKPDELFNQTELTQIGGAGLVSKIHDRMMSVSKIWNKLTGKAQVKTVKGVDDKDKIERDITKQTYIDPAQRATNIKGYQYQPNLSDPELAVYKNRNTNELVIGHRGSSNMDDVKTDLRLAVGGIKRTDRYKRDKDKVDDVIRANPESKLVFTGHSLGGTQAIEMLRNHPNGRAVVFNAGHTPFRDGSVKHDDITYYTKKGDAVSMLGANAYKNVKYLDDDDKGNFISNHLMSNFDDKENKNPDQPDAVGGALLEGYDVPNATGIAGAGLSDVKKMRKHLENLRKAEDTPEKVVHLNRMMRDANKVEHPKLRSDMLKVAGGILETL